MDKGELLFVVEIPPNFQADILAQRKTEIQINVDATAVAQAGNGASYLRTAIFNEVQNFISKRGGSVKRPDQSRRPREIQSKSEDRLVLGNDAGDQSDHAPDRDPDRRRTDPRARARHGGALAGHARRAGGDHAGEDVRQWPGHPRGGDAVAAIRRASVDRRADCGFDFTVPARRGALRPRGGGSRHPARHAVDDDGPVRFARDAGADGHATAFGQQHADGEHAGLAAICDADDQPDAAFRRLRSGGAVPRRRSLARLAAAAGHAGHRLGLFRCSP